MRRRSWIQTCLFAGLVGGVVVSDSFADSVSYAAANVTNNSSSLSSQFGMTVGNDGVASNQMWILFENMAGGAASSIANIYFEDGPILGISTLEESTGVDFQHDPGSPENPPGINNFATTVAFSVNAKNPKPENGVNPGEWLKVIFNLQSGVDFSDTVAAIENGFLKTAGDQAYNPNAAALRVAFHLIALGDGKSDTYMLGPESVPLPAPVSMALAGLLGAVAYSSARRRLRATSPR